MKLYGKNPILERIKKNPRSIQKLYLQKKTDLSELVKEAQKAALEFQSVDKNWMEHKCGSVHTQGVMAEIEEFVYVPFSRVLKDCLEGVSIPVFLDGITDPQNLGAIVRNLACMGGFSVVLPEHRAVHVNETVLRVANGGENYVRIAKVPNLATAAEKAKEKGIWITGALAEGNGSILDAELVFPMVVVIGSEGKGVRPGLKKHLDLGLSLPMRGAPLSYNVAVATSLFCYEITRRRFAKG